MRNSPGLRRQSDPKYRRRSSPGQDRLDYRVDDERRYGVLLQEQVDRQLGRLNVPHRAIANDDAYARSERVELVVETGDARVPAVEFQYQLRPPGKTAGKVVDFLRAAIQRASQAIPRVFLFIDLRETMRVNELADRVAHAVRAIVRNVRAYKPEPGNVIGLTMRVVDRRALNPEPTSLFAVVSAKARAFLNGLVISIETTKAIAEEALRKARAAAAKKHALERLAAAIAARGTQTFHLVSVVREHFHGFRPHPAPVHATSQNSHPLRMPFRR